MSRVAAGSSRFAFTGDGHHPGDGGAELQRLWTLHVWRPLAKCGGRYAAVRSSGQPGIASCSLSELCESWQLRCRSPVLRVREPASSIDGVDCVRLEGGGGLLTYVKPDGAFVHTLNTESGLCRKLLALEGAARPRQQLCRALEPQSSAVFGALCALLAAIPEAERTQAAPAVAVAMRSHLARRATRPDAAPRTPLPPPPAELSCMPCDEAAPEPESEAAAVALKAAAAPVQGAGGAVPRGPKRSVDYLLEGRSVASNRHLRRFAAAPYLFRLLTEPGASASAPALCSPGLSHRTSSGLPPPPPECFGALPSTTALPSLPRRGSLFAAALAHLQAAAQGADRGVRAGGGTRGAARPLDRQQSGQQRRRQQRQWRRRRRRGRQRDRHGRRWRWRRRWSWPRQ